MICNYKAAAETQKKYDVCLHLGNRWLDYIEAETAIELNRLFGWKAKRLGDMYDGEANLLAEMMGLYASDGEDIWETTLTANHGLGMRLRGIGVDFAEWMREIPIVDRFAHTWRNKRDRDQHDFRANWIETMEKKLTVYWAVLLLWLNERHGFGAVRLKRFFEAVRMDYIKFAGKYLMCKKSIDYELTSIIEDKVREAKALLGEVEPAKAFISVEEFIKNHKKIAPTA
jgi:hypothetical protein